MAMIARRPLTRSWQKTTCSCPASLRWSVRSKTLMASLLVLRLAGPAGEAAVARPS
jgi:hypothetical protein